MPPMQFELDDVEAELLAHEVIRLAMRIEEQIARTRADHIHWRIAPPDETLIQARVVLLRDFAAVARELVEEARS